MANEEFVYQFRQGTAAQAAANNQILGPGEPGVETDTNKFKLGNGVTPWNDLPYFIDEMDVKLLIESYLENLENGTLPAPSVTPDVVLSDGSLQDHVNSETPHPVYDDGPSFLLLYQNAKV